MLSLLLVDRDPTFLAARRSALSRHGIDVAVSQCCADCQALVPERHAFDLAVVDFDAPNGVQPGCGLGCPFLAARRLPFIVAADDQQPARMLAAIESGAYRVLLKHVPANELVQHVIIASARAAEMNHARARLERLRESSEAAQVVAIAVGIIMTRFGLLEADAYRVLRHTARSSREKLASVSRRIVDRSGGIELLQALMFVATRAE